MNDAAPSPARRGRPPSEAARRAILKAARELLDEGGVLSVTMEGIAARAGVGKPTVYRHWSNRYEVVMAALIEATAAAEAPVAPRRRRSRRWASSSTASPTCSPRPPAATSPMMLVSGYGETALSKAFRIHFVQARRDEGRGLLRQAVAGGEIRADVDLELALDLIYGPIFYRLTMAHAPIDASFVDALLREVLAGIAADGK